MSKVLEHVIIVVEERDCYLDRYIRPSDAHESTGNDSENREYEHDRSPVQPTSAFKLKSVIQPEETREAIGIPRSEERCGDTDQIGKDWYSYSQNEGQADCNQAQDDPHYPPEECVRVNMS